MLLDLTIPLEVKKAESYLAKLIEGKSKIELKKINNKRSLKINSYLHICLTLYAVEFGYSIDEAKTFFKRKCDFMIYTKNGERYLKKTSKLDNNDCSKFVEFIRNFSAEQGCYIPDAEEYKENQFNIDKSINNHKQYL